MSRVTVVGAGTMGNGIAHVFAQHGWDTLLVDVSGDQLDRTPPVTDYLVFFDEGGGKS